MNHVTIKREIRPEIILFFILIAAVALGNGLSDSIFSNYFKEVYGITALQRGFIELPRELPGLVCALVFGLLGFLGDLRMAFIAQALSLAGLTALGLFTPAFGLMLVFLFVNSMGMHLFMPLQDAIGMSMAEKMNVGRRLGQFFSVRSAFGFLAALLVFFGFRTGFFTFDTQVRWVFLVGSAAFAIALAATVLMIRRVRPTRTAARRLKLVFRKEYRYFYLLTILHGVQKQIAYVYGVWVVVDILLRKADTLALLFIVVSFLSIFFLPVLGKWMDRYGVRRMMFMEALAFIGVYIVYGAAVWAITSGKIPAAGWGAWIVYFLFILDRLSMQMGMVKSVYLRSIAFNEEEITSTLSMGVSLDHAVSILAALAGGFVWAKFGSHYVFFMAAAFSLGNLYAAFRARPGCDEPARRQSAPACGR
ncbi:MAG: MFS transporter [Clostridiales bacterium]|nr:MFS transporter [Clostridiales bacterium]